MCLPELSPRNTTRRLPARTIQSTDERREWDFYYGAELRG